MEVTMGNRSLPVAVAILGLAFGSARAHAASIQTAVPFEFVVGDKVLPPATYIVETANGTEPSVLTAAIHLARQSLSKPTGSSCGTDPGRLTARQRKVAGSLMVLS
jgi:hypothetical protein